MVGYQSIPEGHVQRILWDGFNIQTAIMKEEVARDFDRCFSGKAVPNPIQYGVFLEKREAVKTIVALEDLVEQYALTNVKLPMVVEQINYLREKYNLYEQKEKQSNQ